jgi:hypothetical protein
VWINLPFFPGCNYIAFSDEAANTSYQQGYYQYVCTYIIPMVCYQKHFKLE